MKTCKKCLKGYPLEEFATRSAMCKPCHREYTREHYKKNKQAYLDKARRNDGRYIHEAREVVLEHFASNPCVDCGESDPIVLEFDHIDPTQKLFTIAHALRGNKSAELLKAEIEKCEVRCANCHRRRTARQFGWWRVNAPVYPDATNVLKG